MAVISCKLFETVYYLDFNSVTMSVDYMKKNRSINDHAFLIPFLEVYGFDLDQSTRDYKTKSEISRFLIRKVEPSFKNVEKVFDSFSKRVKKGFTSVPKHINKILAQNDSHGNLLNTILDGSKIEVFWEILAYALSLKIDIFMLDQDRFRIAKYGPINGCLAYLLCVDQKYRALTKSESKKKTLNNNNKDKLFHLKFQKNLKFGKDHEFKTDECQQTALMNGSSTDARRNITLIEPYENSLDNIDQVNHQKKKAQNIKEYSTDENDVNSDGKVFDSKNKENLRNYNGEMQGEGYNIIDIYSPSSKKLTRKQLPKSIEINGVSFKIEQPYDLKSNFNQIYENKYSFSNAINFISEYHRNYTSLIKPYIDSKCIAIDGRSTETRSIEGKIKFYNDSNKYGFIVSQGKEFLLHKDNLVRSRIDSTSLANCCHFFDVLVRLRVQKYNNGIETKTRADYIEYLNFVPKHAVQKKLNFVF